MTQLLQNAVNTTIVPDHAKNTKLWIDDLRTPPVGDWDWAKTSQEAIALLDQNTYHQVSFDHDLGGDDTSRKVVLHICETGFHFPPILSIHSANIVGREWLVSMFRRYAPASRIIMLQYSSKE